MKTNNYKILSHLAFGLITYIPIALIFLTALLIYGIHNFLSLFLVAVFIISPFVGYFFEIPALTISIYSYKQSSKYKKLNIATIILSGIFMLAQIVLLLRFFGPVK